MLAFGSSDGPLLLRSGCRKRKDVMPLTGPASRASGDFPLGCQQLLLCSLELCESQEAGLQEPGQVREAGDEV